MNDVFHRDTHERKIKIRLILLIPFDDFDDMNLLMKNNREKKTTSFDETKLLNKRRTRML